MRIVVDALPINNFSGRHVLCGHLEALRRATADRHEVTIVGHAGNRDLGTRLPHVTFVEIADLDARWFPRLRWQVQHMQRTLDELRADLLLSTSGALVPRVRTPQLVLAQNPWCFWSAFHDGPAARLKAALQRIGYRRAQRDAAAVLCLSGYVADEYRRNAGCDPRLGDVLYVGVDDDRYPSTTLTHAERRCAILTVSVMAPHKAVEDVVRAFSKVAERKGDAELRLAGPWADTGYRRDVEALVALLDLQDRVLVLGELSEADLLLEYASSRAFCLLSRCESFGIPAIEAQAAGTPTIVADVCAPPEVAGPGGEVVAPGDLDAAADSMLGLLENEARWSEASGRALENAERFRWDVANVPLQRTLHRLDEARFA
jgi:glycosyltransferase involved in cell wall biosynthesis